MVRRQSTRRESKAERESCQTRVNLVDRSECGKMRGKTSPRSADQNQRCPAESLSLDALYSHFKIRPVQRWQLIAGVQSIESHTFRGRRDCLQIRWRHAAQTRCNLPDGQSPVQSRTFEIAP